MSNYWFGSAMGYHGGDPLPGDVQIPQRPDPSCTWDGAEWSAPLPPPAPQATVAALQAALIAANVLTPQQIAAQVTAQSAQAAPAPQSDQLATPTT